MSNDDDPMDPASSKVTSSHYEALADKSSYEDAYFYEPGAYMTHLVRLHVERMGLATTSKRRLLDIGGGTGNFAQALAEAVSTSKVEIVVVEPFLDPTVEQSNDSSVSFVKAGAEAFLEEDPDEKWRQPGSYHQILMKEIVHHLDAKDRVGIFRGMYHGLAKKIDDNDSPSMLIVTRPQVDIDYPLWAEARQVWKDNQPSVEELSKDLQEAGFHGIQHTIEAYPCSIALERWQSMIRNRFWSTFSNFSDQELAEACSHIAEAYKDRIDDDSVIHFEDRLVFLTADK